MSLKRSLRSQPRPFMVMDVMSDADRLETAGRDVLHLEIGQPSTAAPRRALVQAGEVLLSETLGYTAALGIEPLRRRIARYYQEIHGIPVPIERIVVTPGSSGGFNLAFLAAFDVGDRVALAVPGYPAYKNILSALGIEAVEIPAVAGDRYQPTPASIEALGSGIDGLIVASPANPTGTMLSADDLSALVSYCSDRGIRLVSDEIYHGITYSSPGVSALAFTDDAIVINSFSKYYSMTGWRIGWMVIPRNLCRAVECLAQNLFISSPALSQHVALAAFECTEELDANVDRYAANREFLLRELPTAGLGNLAPADGAFYIYADIRHLTNDSESFCRRLLQDTGVAIAPGVDFDSLRGNAAVRLSFAGPAETIEKAVWRLRDWLKR